MFCVNFDSPEGAKKGDSLSENGVKVRLELCKKLLMPGITWSKVGAPPLLR